MHPDLDPDAAKDVEIEYRSASVPTLYSACLSAVNGPFPSCQTKLCKWRQKSESPNACYSPLNGISHAGHITRGWDL